MTTLPRRPSYESNRRGMEQIIAGLKRLGLEHIPSHGNFVTFEVADAAAGQRQAAASRASSCARSAAMACPTTCA
jgi:histidinol-phosphate/aromatic aminotransferase/cobyric acid decarboxylase-like protein